MAQDVSRRGEGAFRRAPPGVLGKAMRGCKATGLHNKNALSTEQLCSLFVHRRVRLSTLTAASGQCPSICQRQSKRNGKGCGKIGAAGCHRIWEVLRSVAYFLCTAFVQRFVFRSCGFGMYAPPSLLNTPYRRRPQEKLGRIAELSDFAGIRCGLLVGFGNDVSAPSHDSATLRTDNVFRLMPRGFACNM